MSDDLTDAIARVCAIEDEAITPIHAIDCVPFFFHSQEAFPYITHRWSQSRMNNDSEDIEVRERELIARLVIGHMTEGYKGEPEANLYTLLDELENAFANSPMLISAEFEDEPIYLHPLGCRTNFNRGAVVFETSGISVKQVGTEFSIFVPMFSQINVLNNTPPSP